MSNRNGKQKPFSHKDHAVALQGQVDSQQREIDSLRAAGQAVDAKRMLYANTIASLMRKLQLDSVVISPDHFDDAFVFCSCRFTHDWHDRDDGLRDCEVRLIPHDAAEQAKNREAVDASRAKIAAAQRQAKALEDSAEADTDDKPPKRGPRLLGSDGEPL